jgi:hypothetical protein
MHPSGLTDREVEAIRLAWAHRPTITSLSRKYGISTDMVRRIIGAHIAPVKKRGENNN